jgi:hypothetical protein
VIEDDDEGTGSPGLRAAGGVASGRRAGICIMVALGLENSVVLLSL